jgi:ribosomal protein S18 acetylase RimI-like enzyme
MVQIRNALTEGRFPTFIAEEDGNGMGLAICEVRFYPAQPRPSVAIHVLEVEEQYRRCGVATALIGRVKEFARSNNAVIIELVASHTNLAALKFYVGLEFEDREDVRYYTLALDTK